MKITELISFLAQTAMEIQGHVNPDALYLEYKSSKKEATPVEVFDKTLIFHSSSGKLLRSIKIIKHRCEYFNQIRNAKLMINVQAQSTLWPQPTD